MYIGIVLGSGLRGDEDRKRVRCWVEIVESYVVENTINLEILKGIVRMYDIDVDWDCDTEWDWNWWILWGLHDTDI